MHATADTASATRTHPLPIHFRGRVLTSGNASDFAEAAGMSVVDISKILAGRFQALTDLLKPLAAVLDVPQMDLLRAAGVLEAGTAQPNRPLTVQVAAQRLGIKSPKNVAAFEALVAALRDAEKRR